MRTPCTNCGTQDCGAKNSEYCTSCEMQWYETYHRVVRKTDTPNPLQKLADGIIEKYGTYDYC